MLLSSLPDNVNRIDKLMSWEDVCCFCGDRFNICIIAVDGVRPYQLQSLVQRSVSNSAPGTDYAAALHVATSSRVYPSIYPVTHQHRPTCMYCSGASSVLYTVCHKYGATELLAIRLAFLEQFLRFLYPWKQEWILYILVRPT